MKAVYGIHYKDIARLAETLTDFTGIRLYSVHSPMIGVWYSAHDPATISSILKKCSEGGDGEALLAANSGPQIMLRLNDGGDPYYGGAEFPGRGDCLLEVEGDSDWVYELEEGLYRAWLQYEIIKLIDS